MPGPALSGLFVYAKHLDRLAGFYAAVAGLTTVHSEPGLAVLQSAEGLQLVVHAIPEAIGADIVIGEPPARRADVALKFFFSVPDLAAAGARAARLGGQLFEAERWSGPGFTVCNAMDPEGNVFQLREARGA